MEAKCFTFLTYKHKVTLLRGEPMEAKCFTVTAMLTKKGLVSRTDSLRAQDNSTQYCLQNLMSISINHQPPSPRVVDSSIACSNRVGKTL